jgi:uracil-DNA glycosylase
MSLEPVKLEPEWKAALSAEFSKPYMKELGEFLGQEAASKKDIFPDSADIFNAFNLTPLSKVKVVILGQDPYHGLSQAHGLSFSVKKGIPPPPSLKNIFKELATDLNLPIPKAGDLTPWAKQGVLLLNTVLTVEKGLAASHRKKGWEQFTDQVIRVLNAQKHSIVFILWGAFAHKKAEMINSPPHEILQAPHPSPLSAYSGFWGSKPFSQTNKLLAAHGEAEINWRLEA